jgi:hypothetical protein
MFNVKETLVIEESKRAIKSQINARSLLWNGITRNVVIAGGFFTSVMQNKPFKDIDIFVLNNDVDVYNHLTEGYHTASAMVQITMTEKGEWRRSEMMTYMHNTNILDVINNTKTDAQYILTKYETREELLAHFDYKHCKVSYVPEEDKLYINRETFDCIQNKILKWNNKQLDQPNQIYRKNNFLNQGWVLETDNEPYANLKSLTSDKIKESYQNLKEQMAAQMLETGLPPMQQQSQGFVAQIVNEILQPK